MFQEIPYTRTDNWYSFSRWFWITWRLCNYIKQGDPGIENVLRSDMTEVKIPKAAQDNLIACLKDIGIIPRWYNTTDADYNQEL